MTNVAQWGQQAVVEEPPTGPNVQPVRLSLASVTHAIVDAMSARGVMPPVRDWTVYLQAEGVQELRAVAPVVEAVITYGSGATSFERRVWVPPYGTVVHVVATTIDVLMLVYNSTLNGQGPVKVAAYISPGRPVLQRQSHTVFQASTPVPYRFPIPPFATSVLLTSLRAGVTAPLAWNWFYRTIPRGTGNTPSAATAGSYNVARALPSTVDEIRLLPNVADVSLCMWWEIFS